ncbi:unnamed protein product [Toxocara canis]|uniref:Uncharacterized protein n=1 Tax=Toxocara canis TaxID=6265 RepID=A0A183TXY6_TOXCA|nr:unnamed protein product [Toxocara canis]
MRRPVPDTTPGAAMNTRAKRVFYESAPRVLCTRNASAVFITECRNVSFTAGGCGTLLLLLSAHVNQRDDAHFCRPS